jgi:roadblock/LC7 domain-containing protein
MKKITTLCIGSVALFINAQSQQFNVQTKTFDLEKLNLHKEWRIYSGFKENNGNYIIKLGKPSCNMTTSSSSYTYYGIQYDFEELTFDASLDYVSKTSKSFPNTISTLSYEPVLGKRFFPLGSQGLLKRPLTQDYIGKKIVLPVTEMTGYKIGLYQIIGKTVAPGSGFMGATNYYSCGENIWMDKLESQKSKENKGERWFPVTNYPTPGGGIIIFSTSGVVPESDNAVFIAKLYDAESLNETARSELSFDFKCVVHVLPLEQNDGTRDFVVIAQADDGKYSLGKKVMEATHGELLVLDGKTLKIKNRSGFKMEYSRWFPENVVVNNKGDIFIYGTCSDGTKEYPGKQGLLQINQFMPSPNTFNMPKDQPNFQLLMADANGNVKYVKGVNSKEAKNISKVIEGTEKNAKNDVILNTYDFNKEYFFTDKYLILAGQQYIGAKKDGVDKGNLFVALFDLATGKLTHYFIKPEDTYSTFDIIFNKDRTQMYWATYDLESLNDIENEHGAMKAKKIKSMIAGNLHLAKIDLNSGTATNFEWIGKEQWAVNFSAPVVVKDDNSNEIIFQGRTLNKKAKDSELVFIKVSK